jgi:hypothetical protein
MKRETQEKRTKPVKCRFFQKYRSPVVPTAALSAAVTRKVSEEVLLHDAPPPLPPAIISRPLDAEPAESPQSPLSVVTHQLYSGPRTMEGGFSPASIHEETTTRSVSDSSMDHEEDARGEQQQQHHHHPERCLSSAGGLLKRRAKSMCLTELASPSQPTLDESSYWANTTTTSHNYQPDAVTKPFSGLEPSPKSTTAAWGLFVDLDEHHHHHLLHHLLPLRVDRRRPLRLRRRPRLKGFVLADIDETTSQLGSLSFDK